MDFGLIFIIILDYGFWSNFHPNTIDYGFWSNFHHNTIDYRVWSNFHPNTIDYGFWSNFHHNTIDYGVWSNFHPNTMDFGLIFILILQAHSRERGRLEAPQNFWKFKKTMCQKISP